MVMRMHFEKKKGKKKKDRCLLEVDTETTIKNKRERRGGERQ
jgi:hypothetical protein